MSETNESQPPSAHAKTSRRWFKPGWYKPLGQLFELFSVVAITSVLGLLWMEWTTLTKFLLSVLSIVVAGGLFTVAVAMTARANNVDEEKRKADNKKKHLISELRLRVLRQAKVPSDVTTFLRTLLLDESQPSSEVVFTAAELSEKLSSGLGSVRASEVKETVLKYTETQVKENKPLPPDKPPVSGEPRVQVESNGKGKSQAMSQAAVTL